MIKKLFSLVITFFIVFLGFTSVYSQLNKGKPVYTIPCSIYDSPIIMNEKLKIVNLGPSVNSPEADYAPTITLDGKTIIFSSNRTGGIKYENTVIVQKAISEFIVLKFKNKYDTVPSTPQLKKQIEDMMKSTSESKSNKSLVDSIWYITDSNRVTEKKVEIKDNSSTGDFWFISKFDRLDTIYVPPQNLNSSNIWGTAELSSSLQEGTPSISADGKMIFFTKCLSPDGYGDCDIFYSRLDGKNWTKPMPLDSNINSDTWEAQSSIAPYNKRIYFTSTRSGPNSDGSPTKKNMDIWYSDWSDEVNGWQNAKNLTAINSKGTDCGPFIAADGVTLFFSSDGIQPNFGGLDFYVTRYNPINDTWSQPVNLGKPINTEQDDQFICIPASGDVIYFSSNRKDIPNYQGDRDLFMAYVPDYQSNESCAGESSFQVNNYPNPFSQNTTIEYSIVEPGNITIVIVSVNGEEVSKLVEEKQFAGTHKIIWDGKKQTNEPASSGMYLVKVDYEVDGVVKQIFKKIMLMR